ncbi:MAG: anti-sigma factor [Actinomycetota bacterium]|nr:anti-sigma factor [Actinomycetota bacterium]
MTDVPYEHGTDAGGWVLGALSPEEAKRFAAHLETCAACRAEVARLTEASERLADAAPTLTPPLELRERLMASVHAETSLFDAASADPSPPEPAHRRGRSRRRAGGLLAAFGTLAIVIAAIALLTANHPPHQAAARTVIGKVTTQGGTNARAVVQIGAHTATLSVTHLAPPAAGRVYQAWVIRRGSPATPTGALFSVPRSGDTRILLPTLHDVTEVIVTAEPPRGSPTPSLPPIVLVQLTARPGRTALKP